MTSQNVALQDINIALWVWFCFVYSNEVFFSDVKDIVFDFHLT